MSTPSYEYRPNHQRIIEQIPYLATTPDPRPENLCGIFTPTSRSHRDPSRRPGVLTARAAEEYDAQQILLRSKEAAGEEPRLDEFPRTSEPALAVDIPDGFLGMFEFESDKHPVSTCFRDSDLSFKRNLAIAIGVMAHWDVMLLLDDDIRLDSPGARRRTGPEIVAGTEFPQRRVLKEFDDFPELEVAAYIQRDFDDNSVAGRTRALLGMEQELFPSGGAMLVRSSISNPFFPGTYNEDWLFMLQVMLKAERNRPYSVVKLAGQVHQQPYDGYRRHRARSEEIGDIFAEALFNLLEDYPPSELRAEASSPLFWTHAVDARCTMIHTLAAELHRRRHTSGSPEINSAIKSMDEALGVHRKLGDRLPTYFAEYFKLMELDRNRWQKTLEGYRARSGGGMSAQEAIRSLGLEVTSVNPRTPLLKNRNAVPKPRPSGSATGNARIIEIPDGSDFTN